MAERAFSCLLEDQNTGDSEDIANDPAQGTGCASNHSPLTTPTASTDRHYQTSRLPQPRTDRCGAFTTPCTENRKRSRFEAFTPETARNNKTHSRRNGPFIELSSSEEEEHATQRPSQVRKKGSSRASAFKEHRRGQLERAHGGQDATLLGFPIKKEEERDLAIADETASIHHAAEEMDVHKLPVRSHLGALECHKPEDTREIVPPDNSLHLGMSIQQQTSRGSLAASVEERFADRERSTQSDPVTRYSTHEKPESELSLHAYSERVPTAKQVERLQETPSTNVRSTGRMALLTPTDPDSHRSKRPAPLDQQPPRNKHQQWLKHSKKILSQSLKHAGTLGISNAPPITEASKAEYPQSAVRNGLRVSKNGPGDAARTSEALLSTHSIKQQSRLEASQEPCSTSCKSVSALGNPRDSSPNLNFSRFADFRDSAVSENDRFLLDWRQEGTGWDEIVRLWQRKTGSLASKSTLEKRHNFAKKCMEYELNGIRIAKRQQQRQAFNDIDISQRSPATLDDPHRDCEADGRQDPAEERLNNNHATTGGKSFDSEVFMARMAEIREAQEEEARLEQEQASGFFRDQSPQPGEQGDPVYFIYRVTRRDWSDCTARKDDGQESWYRTMDPKSEFSSLIAANAAGMQETLQTRHHVGPHMRFSNVQGHVDKYGMYHWSFEGQDGSGYEVKVVRELAAAGPGYQAAESKLGWFKKRVWVVKKRTETCVETEVDHLFEETKVDVKIKEEQLKGVYTSVDQANREAAEIMLCSATKKDSVRIDDIDRRTRLQEKLAEKCDELEARDEAFTEEYEHEGGRTRFIVWVEQDHLLGPRNI